MLAAVQSAAVCGIEAYDVTVEVDAARGLPQWTIVGLPAHSIRESRERVSAALANAGFSLPPRRYTVNLAPADQKKDGTAFDLPIALGVLSATGQISPDALKGIVAVGELGLDGSLRAVRGALPVAARAAKSGARALIVPPGNAGEAALIPALASWSPGSLGELVRGLRTGRFENTSREEHESVSARDGDTADLADVAGQGTARRALEIAAAGGHALLMIGAPGAGKTMLARRLPGILPDLTPEEAMEVLTVQSVAGLLSATSWQGVRRPFRSPHYSLSVAALVGGGSRPRPGEVSLAHHGVLFLDELQEMPRSRLDSLRQPMEDGVVTIARAQTAITYPARFALVGAMNPCPCGYAGNQRRACACAAADIIRHRSRISGPLADRIDMTVNVPPVPIESLGRAGGESSESVRARVRVARERQQTRYAKLTVSCNAQAAGRWLEMNTAVSVPARVLLSRAASTGGLSARAYHRILRLARTIADLDGSDEIDERHIAEALYFRAADSGA
ncbi:MAG: YifB family Mg chelatase-like AAA ATPase [Gemmatimonadota bacterium]